MKYFGLIVIIGLINLLPSGCKLETELVVVSQSDHEILFKDDFSGDLSQWDITAGTWGIQNNKLKGIGYHGGLDAWIYAGDVSWTDYEISFTVYFVDGNAELVVRSTGHGQDEFRIDIFSEDWGNPGDDSSNTYAFSHYINGEYSWIQDSLGNVNRLCPFSISNPAYIKVSITGSELSLYINDIFIDRLIHSELLQAGKIGLGVVWAGECKFDNVVVQEL